MKSKISRMMCILLIALVAAACSACDGFSPPASTATNPPTSTATNPPAQSVQTQSVSTQTIPAGFYLISTYSFTHQKDGATYTIKFFEKSEMYGNNPLDTTFEYKAQVLDAFSHSLQIFDIDFYFKEYSYWTDFDDVNLDGYTDLLLYSGGTMNEMYDAYTWQPASHQFEKVQFEGTWNAGFAYYTVYDGYIENMWKDIEEYTIEKLVWRGNTLVKVSEETFSLLDEPDE